MQAHRMREEGERLLTLGFPVKDSLSRSLTLIFLLEESKDSFGPQKHTMPKMEKGVNLLIGDPLVDIKNTCGFVSAHHLGARPHPTS